MASIGPRSRRPEGRIISFYRPDVHVEARRMGAAGIDLLILFVVQTWIDDVFGVTRAARGSPLDAVGTGYVFFTGSTTVGLPWLALIAVAVFSVQEALFGATWGKLAAGLRIVSVDGARPAVAAVVVRNILRLIDYWPLLYAVGIISVGFSPLRQRLGDRAGRTLVVRAESAALARRTPAEMKVRIIGLGAFLLLFAAFSFGFSYFGRPPLVIQGLVNTDSLPGPHPYGISSYALGTPSRRGGLITYRVSYVPTREKWSCSGRVTLTWKGFFSIGGGWRLQGGQIRCA